MCLYLLEIRLEIWCVFVMFMSVGYGCRSGSQIYVLCNPPPHPLFWHLLLLNADRLKDDYLKNGEYGYGNLGVLEAGVCTMHHILLPIMNRYLEGMTLCF